MTPTIAMAIAIAMDGEPDRGARALAAGRVRVRTARRADAVLAPAASAAWEARDHDGYARVQRARAALEPVIDEQWGGTT